MYFRGKSNDSHYIRVQLRTSNNASNYPMSEIQDIELAQSSEITDKQTIAYFNKLLRSEHLIAWVVPEEQYKSKYETSVAKVRERKKALFMKSEHLKLAILPYTKDVTELVKIPFHSPNDLLCLITLKK